MRPLGPQLCSGKVYHRRLVPTVHQFTYPISYVLFDPDRPGDLTGRHPLWSSDRWSPAQVLTADYGGDAARSGDLTLAGEVRSELADVVGSPEQILPVGSVRLLTQPRRWGWLFNPISVFFAWSVDSGNPGGSSHGDVDSVETESAPVGVVLEVTNTPWKERHRYPMALESAQSESVDGCKFSAEFDKVLHVSPFLDEDYRYRLSIEWSEAVSGSAAAGLKVGVDVIGRGDQLVVETLMDLEVIPADRQTLGRSIRSDGLPTHRTSYGIHRQAASLAKKRVPFIAHPKSRRTAPSEALKGGKT